MLSVFTVVDVVSLSLVYSCTNTDKWIFFNMNKNCDLRLPEIFKKDSPERKEHRVNLKLHYHRLPNSLSLPQAQLQKAC